MASILTESGNPGVRASSSGRRKSLPVITANHGVSGVSSEDSLTSTSDAGSARYAIQIFDLYR